MSILRRNPSPLASWPCWSAQQYQHMSHCNTDTMPASVTVKVVTYDRCQAATDATEDNKKYRPICAWILVLTPSPSHYDSRHSGLYGLRTRRAAATSPV